MYFVVAVLVLIPITLLAYGFIGYPAFLRFANSTSTETFPAAKTEPSITLFVAARNEEKHIQNRLDNLLRIHWSKIRIVVVSDGSSDATDTIVRNLYQDQGVVLFRTDGHVGKAQALNGAIQRYGDADILVFTDATAYWPDNALKELLKPFASPTVGGTSGLVLYNEPNSNISKGFSTYQDWVVETRQADSNYGSVLSVSGSISAIRRELWEPIAPGIDPDLAIPAFAEINDQRAVLTRAAISQEVARTTEISEFKSRVRLALGAYGFVSWLWHHRSRLPQRYLFQVVSAKVLRWFSPILYFMLIVGFSILAMMGNAWAKLTLVAALMPIMVGMLGFGIARFSLTVAAAYLVGLFRFAVGQRLKGWNPEEQR